MTYQPVIPIGGVAGWAFLQRTRATQQSAFDASPAIQRDTAYFAQSIGDVTTAQQLTDDRRLLKVALGAFGLDGDIGNKYFIRKVLEDGSLDSTALAQKLSDKRYLEFSRAFGFGDYATPSTQISDFGTKIVSAYKERQFEIAVGAQDQDLRLAIGLSRDLGEILNKTTTPDGMWYSVMGNPPLRKVFETALGLPPTFGALDLGQQLSGFRDKARAAFGDSEIAQFSNPENASALNRLFLARSQINAGQGSLSGGAIALMLLSGAS